MFFLFNTGQLAHEKSKLVNSADAAAYSAGVMNARALNFDAYTNRAMVANTVAIAQLVSLSSWIQYVDRLATYGVNLNNPKFVSYYPSYLSAQYSGTYAKTYLLDTGTLEKLAIGSDRIIRSLLMNAQAVARAALIPARAQLMDEVVRENYRDDGVVSVQEIPLPGDGYTRFVKRYDGEKRERFAEVTTSAVRRDRFVGQRSWMLPALWADCGGAYPNVDWLDRSGGTDLVGFDEWRAMDTLSEKRWTPRHQYDVFCQAIAERPTGWGSQPAAETPSIDPDLTHYDYARIINPGSGMLALAMSSDAWQYSGLPGFHDLSEDALKDAEPRLRLAVRLGRRTSETITSEGRSAISPTPRLNAYAATPAGGQELVAVSASEAFFQRPPSSADNAFGLSIGKPREIGSLFNPYWQVRLVQSDAAVAIAQGQQGALLP